MSELLYIPVDQIHSSGNVRIDVVVDEPFVQSIRDNGILQPVSVRPNDAGFDLVDGHRRLAGAKEAGLTQVPAFVLDSEENRTVLQLVQNLQRQDLDPIEEALAFQNLANEGLQQAEIAKRVGVTQPHISKRISLLRLSDSVQNKVRNGTLDVNIAVDLAKIRDHAHQDRLVKDGVNEHKMAMALKRQKDEDDLAKFIKRVGQNVPLSEVPDLTGYRVFGTYSTLKEYQAADIPEDAITTAQNRYGEGAALVVYVPSYGNSIVDAQDKDEKKAAAKLEREAARERESHLKTIVAKAVAKDVATLSTAFLFDRLVTANNARKISILLNLDPTVGDYIVDEKVTDYSTGEVKTRKSTDYVKLVNDWYVQGAKESTQAVMAALIVNFDDHPQGGLLAGYLHDKGVPTLKELLDNQDS